MEYIKKTCGKNFLRLFDFILFVLRDTAQLVALLGAFRLLVWVMNCWFPSNQMGNERNANTILLDSFTFVAHVGIIIVYFISLFRDIADFLKRKDES